MTSIIFQNVYDQFFDLSDNINNYFLKMDTYKTDIYYILESLPKSTYIIYIVVIFIIFRFVLSQNITISHLFSFFIALFIVYFLIRYNYSSFMKYISHKSDELKFLNKLMYDHKDFWITAGTNNFFVTSNNNEFTTYLYLDPVVIDLFINIKPMIVFNLSAYVTTLFHVNNVIGIDYQSKIGVNRQYLNYNSAVLEKNKALNSLNSSIYKLPESIIPKYMKSIKLLHKILSNYLLSIGKYFKNNNKLNDLTVDKMPDDFYDIDFVISADDTKTRDYISVYDMYV